MSEIVDIAIDGTNNLVLTWFDDRKVTGGSTKNLSAKRKAKSYKAESDRDPKEIVGIGIDGTNDHVFAWYSDRTVSAGKSTDLASRRKAQKYSLPTGKEPADIVSMGIDGTNNLVCTWYSDGTVSYGSSTKLDGRRETANYKLPDGKEPSDIVAMAIDGLIFDSNFQKHLEEVVGEVVDANFASATKKALNFGKDVANARGSLCFAWYKDGTVSAGTSVDLSEARKQYDFRR